MRIKFTVDELPEEDWIRVSAEARLDGVTVTESMSLSRKQSLGEAMAALRHKLKAKANRISAAQFVTTNVRLSDLVSQHRAVSQGTLERLHEQAARRSVREREMAWRSLYSGYSGQRQRLEPGPSYLGLHGTRVVADEPVEIYHCQACDTNYMLPYNGVRCEPGICIRNRTERRENPF